MAEETVHIAVAIAAGIAGTALSGMPIGWALALGNLAPDLDDLAAKQFGASWITHTAVFPSIMALTAQLVPGMTFLANLVPAFTLGMLMHILLDFLYYEERKGDKGRKFSLFGQLPTAVAMAIAVMPHIPYLLYGFI